MSDGTKNAEPREDYKKGSEVGSHRFFWQEESIYTPAREEVLQALNAGLEKAVLGLRSTIVVRLARAYPQLVLDQFGPILGDGSRSGQERSQAYIVVSALAEVQNSRAKELLMDLLRDPGPRYSAGAQYELLRCYGTDPDVQAMLRMVHPYYAALFGDQSAAQELLRSCDPDTRLIVAGVSGGDYRATGVLLVQAQTEAATRTSQTAVTRQTDLLRVASALQRKELIPYLREYVEREKRKHPGWETGWDASEFLRDEHLYEGVRILCSLGAQLTEHETDYLTYLGILGDPRQTITRKTIHPEDP